ncbi:MAG: sensor histidine kinase, partial [Firmicutes bacterium]|nr:sensor histidine kinase [Bacillota bacterium]
MPIIVSVFYTLSTIRDITAAAVAEGQNQVTKAVKYVQQTSLENQARLVKAEFSKIEDKVAFLQSASQEILNYPALYRPLKDATPLYREAAGYRWTPVSIGRDPSTVFVSSRTPLTPGSMADMGRTKYLEPLFENTTAQNPDIVAVYIILKESITRIYPRLDFKKIIEKGWLPADMDPYQYNFFYTADPAHNPSRKIVWTEPYKDVTDRGWMVTCLAPVYLKNGEFRGIVGVDITLQNIVTGILKNVSFQQPGAYAFILSRNGQVIAAQPKGYRDLGINGKSPNLLDAAKPGLARAAREIVSGGSGLLDIDFSGREQYLFYKPLGISGWSLVFAVPKDEIVNPIQARVREETRRQVRVLIWREVTMFLVVLLVVVALAIFFSYRITRPIQRLMRAAMSLSRDKAGLQIPVTQKDEIGLLTISFNEMSCNIKNLLDHLEARVQERTGQLEKAYQNLKEVNRKILASEVARRTLIANISHELRTPITAIQGYIEALQDGMGQDPRITASYLDIIHRRVTGLNSLIDDLLLLSQLEARLPMNIQLCEATSLFLEIIEKLKDELELAGLAVDMDIDEGLPGVRVDRERLAQVFGNLCANAVKFTPPGGRIGFRAFAGENVVMVQVSDTGVGIAPEDLPHVFERFYRGKRAPLRQVRSH